MASLRRLVAPTTRLYAVVKADAYGHGAVPVARAAVEAGAHGLAVVTLDEAAQLAGQLVGQLEAERIIVMGPILVQEAPEAVAGGFSLTCSSPNQIRALAAAADNARPGRPVPIHLKVDTGMTRYGALPSDVDEIVALLTNTPYLRLTSVWTHLAAAESDPSYSKQQFERLQTAVRRLPGGTPLLHAANSAALIHHPEMALDAVRVGIAIYGCQESGRESGREPGREPGQGSGQNPERDPHTTLAGGLEPVMALRARVGQLKSVPEGTSVGYGRTWVAQRPSRIATVTIGYADGVHRARSNRGDVLVRGERAPLVGRVSMDSLTADVTEIPGVEAGDMVTIIGSDGEEGISAEEVAVWSGTISHDVLTSVGNRVRRVYRG